MDLGVGNRTGWMNRGRLNRDYEGRLNWKDGLDWWRGVPSLWSDRHRAEALQFLFLLSHSSKEILDEAWEGFKLRSVFCARGFVWDGG